MNKKKSCSVFAKVRDRKSGQLTNIKSQLHSKLLALQQFCQEFTRSDANKILGLSQTDSFWNDFKDSMLFDENDEPLLVPLWEELKGNSSLSKVTYDQMKDYLNAIHKSDYYSYDTCLSMAKEFNQKMEGSRTFLGVVKYDPDAKKFLFSVEFNTKSNYENCVNTIQQKVRYDYLVNKLKSVGLSVGTLERTSPYSGEYSNIQQSPTELDEALFQLIKIREKDFDVNSLSAETGHFIIDLLGTEHPLVQRIMNFLSNLSSEDKYTVLKDLLGQEFDNISLQDSNWKLEVAGHLVANYLREAVDKNAVNIRNNKLQNIKRVVGRICSTVLSKIQSLWKDSTVFNSSKQLAVNAAQKLANKFINNTRNFRVTNSIYNGTPVTLHSQATISAAKTKLKNIFQILSVYKDSTKKYFTDDNQFLFTTKSLQDSLQAAKSIFYASSISDLVSYRPLSENDYRQAIKSLIQGLAASLVNINQLYETIYSNTFSVSREGELTQAEWKELLNAYHQIHDILSVFNELKSSLNTFTIPEINQLKSLLEDADIKNIYDSLNQAQNALQNKLVIDWVTKVNGSDAFYIPRHNQFGWGKNARVGDTKKTITSLFDELTSAAPNIWGIDKYLYGVSSDPSILYQTVFIATENQKHKADIASMHMQSRLHKLYIKFTQSSIHISKLLETFPNGEIVNGSNSTGYLISELNWGAWEKALHDEQQRIKEEFLDNNKVEIGEGNRWATTAEALKSSEYKQYLAQNLTLWHAFNSESEDQFYNGIKVNTKYSPKKEAIHPSDVSYLNPEWNKLSKIEQEVATELYQIKKELDALLPPNTTNSHLLPQYTSDWLGMMGNLFRQENLFPAAGKSIAYGATRKTFLKYLRRLDIVAQEEGSESYDIYVQNKEDKNLYDKDYRVRKHARKHAPLYGVHKLDNMATLRPDPFSLMLAHANMCYSYSALQNTADYAEAMCDKIEIKNSSDTNVKSLLKRIEKYLDRHVFRLQAYQAGSSWVSKKYRKSQHYFYNILGKISQFTSLWLLGGNQPSATANWRTALLEIQKIAGAKNLYNYTDLAYAGSYMILQMLKSIFQNGTLNLFKAGDYQNTTPMFLLLRRMSVAGAADYNNTYFGRRLKTFTSLLTYSNAVMMPYSVTDFIFTNLSVIAAMRHTKVYKPIYKMDENGNQVVVKYQTKRLLDIYKKRRIEGENVTEYKRLPSQLREAYIIDEEDENVYTRLTSISHHVNQLELALQREHPEYQVVYEEKFNDENEFIGHQVNVIDTSYSSLGTDNVVQSYIMPLEIDRGIVNARYEVAPEEGWYIYSQAKQIENSFNENEDSILQSDTQNISEFRGKRYRGVKNLIPYDVDQESLLIHKIKRANIKMHGLYASEHKNANLHTFFSVMSLTLKRYLLGLIETSIGQPAYNRIDDDFGEGVTWTFLKLCNTSLYRIYSPFANVVTGQFSQAKDETADSIKFALSLAATAIIPGIKSQNTDLEVLSPKFSIANFWQHFGEFATAGLKNEYYSNSQIENVQLLANMFKTILLTKFLSGLLAPTMAYAAPPEPPEEELELGYTGSIEALNELIEHPERYENTPDGNNNLRTAQDVHTMAVNARNNYYKAELMKFIYENVCVASKNEDGETEWESLDTYEYNQYADYLQTYNETNALRTTADMNKYFAALEKAVAQYSTLSHYELVSKTEFEDKTGKKFKTAYDYYKFLHDIIEEHANSTDLDPKRDYSNLETALGLFLRDRHPATYVQFDKKFGLVKKYSEIQEKLNKYNEKYNPSGRGYKEEYIAQALDYNNSINILNPKTWGHDIVGPSKLIDHLYKKGQVLKGTLTGDLCNWLTSGYNKSAKQKKEDSLLTKLCDLSKVAAIETIETISIIQAMGAHIPEEYSSKITDKILPASITRHKENSGMFNLSLVNLESCLLDTWGNKDFKQMVADKIADTNRRRQLVLDGEIDARYFSEDDPYNFQLEFFYEESANTYKKASTFIPGTPLRVLYQNAKETPNSVVGMMYNQSLRDYIEQTSEPNLASFVMDWQIPTSEILSSANLIFPLAIFSDLTTIYNSADYAYFKDPFVRDSKGKVKYHTNDKGVTLPVVQKGFLEAYYTKSAEYSGFSKGRIRLYSRMPYSRGQKAYLFPYSQSAAFVKSKMLIDANPIKHPYKDYGDNPLNESVQIDNSQYSEDHSSLYERLLGNRTETMTK